MTDYPKRTFERTGGDEMYPDGHLTKEAQNFLKDQSQATRINEAREERLVADFMDFREQDQYVSDTMVKSYLWRIAAVNDSYRYEVGTLYVHNEEGDIIGRVKIEERSPYPFDKPAKEGAKMCLALSTPSRPIDPSGDELGVDWTRELRVVESEDISEHGGAHGIQWARMWDKEEVGKTLAEALGVANPVH
jgi:hypothetical protein